MKPHEAEAGVFGHSAGHVHRLHAIAGGALDEVIDRAERHDALAARIRREADVGEVRPREQLRLGIAKDATAFLHDPDEGLHAVKLPVDLPELLVVERALYVDVRGREDSAHELDRRDRQIDAWSNAAER